jgi:Tol biopolymer transport system component
MEVLICMARHPGEVIPKTRLMQSVWPDTFVTDEVLTNAIWELRKTFGDNAKQPKVIQTVFKRGYRLIAPVSVDNVEVSEAQTETSQQSVTIDPAKRQRAHHRWGLHATRFAKLPPQWAVLVVSSGVVAGLAYLIYTLLGQHVVSKSDSPPTIAHFTSFPGSEFQPAFSPDGKQIAFVWNGGGEDNYDIYTKQVGAPGMLRLTADPGADINPTWSPDGRFVTFLRESHSSHSRYGVYSVPALGGPERKLTEVYKHGKSKMRVRGGFYSLNTYEHSVDWSPDGKLLAVVDRGAGEDLLSIFELNPDTGEKRKLTSPPFNTIGDGFPAYSPDGRTLAFVRTKSFLVEDIYLLSLHEAQITRLTLDDSIIEQVAWTPDSREIIFTSLRESGYVASLWRISVAGGAPVRLAAAGLRVMNGVVARHGDRLAYAQATRDVNIWRLCVGEARKRYPTPIQLSSSTQYESNPQYSPDGRKIAFVSDRSGSLELWVSANDGSDAIQLTSMRAYISSPSWSPDSRHIAFDSRFGGNSGIFVVSVEGGAPRRLTEDATEIVPSWSRDGRWIYFGSDRNGSFQIWKSAPDGTGAMQVTRHGGLFGRESRDGRFFFYAKGRETPGINKVRVEGGEEMPVIRDFQDAYERCWAVTEEGIYLAHRGLVKETRPARIEYFSFSTGKRSIVATLEKQLWHGRISISPDNRCLLYAQMDQSGSDIMLMENFR